MIPLFPEILDAPAAQPRTQATREADGPRPVDVLLVEDNAGDIELARFCLRRLETDVRLHVARDAREALDLLAGSDETALHPDLILLDLNLPGLDGRDLLGRLKSDSQRCLVPVVVLTSSDAESDVRAAYERHANAYVLKSPDVARLLEAMRSIESFWFLAARIPRDSR